MGSNTLSFTYNHDGIRTSKTVNGVIHNYTVSGSLILTEEWGTNLVVYLYDANGAPIGMRYRTSSMAEDVFYTFWFDKNLQGDVVAVYNETGTKVLSYTYDAWGNKTTTVHNSAGSNSYAQYNAITYRGYYFDAETSLYYVSSRYYDPTAGRFINADSYVSTGQGLLGYNMFAYCMSNPVNMFDSSGSWPKWIETAAGWINENIIQPVKDFFSPSTQSNVVNSSSHDANRRPNEGEPGSTFIAPNGDRRTYGPDGKPEHDYDHDDHGQPNQHPHDPNGGHNHDWKNGKRGPAYSIGLDHIAGAALVTACVIGIVVVAADDATGIGVADDCLLGPLGAGVREGLILLLG